MFLEKVFRLVLRLIHYIILSLLFIITNVVVSTASDIKGKYYQSLSKDWRSIFPDGNRNAGGPKFYKHISDKYKNFSEFKEYNKHYCAVSGSLIAENSTPQFIKQWQPDPPSFFEGCRMGVPCFWRPYDMRGGCVLRAGLRRVALDL